MQLVIPLKSYTFTYDQLENFALEFYGKILTPVGEPTQNCDVYFHGGGIGEAYDEGDAKNHLIAFNKALECYEKPKPKKKKE